MTSVDCHHNPVAEPGCCGWQELLLERSGTDEDARCAGLERVLNRVEVAIAAADLHRRPDRCDARDEVESRSAGERAVEIDEVKPGGAVRSEALGSGDGISSLNGHRFAAALRESHDSALEDVDRRVDREGFTR